MCEKHTHMRAHTCTYIGYISVRLMTYNATFFIFINNAEKHKYTLRKKKIIDRDNLVRQSTY